MLSAFPVGFPSDSFLGNPFPPFESCFPPWDSYQTSFVFPPPPKEEEPVAFSPQPSQEPVSSNSGSDTSNPAPVTPNSGSTEPNRNNSKNLSSGSDRSSSKKVNPRSDGTSSRLGPVIDERKRRRMISNRESARRSRMRKQRHLENLRNQANRFKVGNREVMNRLRLVVHQTQLIQAENERLRSEAVVLRQRLWDIRQVLLVRQLQQHMNPSAWPLINNVEAGQPLPHSLIT
ncbi:ocs element-binding factor 1-like [Sesamum indicum]|uniref:Ocs element-binding factor 1-like n=1 Tax=Sesamum indicum TaxID=4182 RepID=A0A8M8V684_SESIN|nr:ocs element-binding factor 1-like [Sesamum indicum]